MNIKEKMEVARQLAQLKVDVIEAGFPIASPGDFEAVRQIAQEVRSASIAGLARALEKDIEAAARALEPADNPRIHVFLSTSKSHRVHMVHKAKAEIVEMAISSLKFAGKFCDNLEFSPMDASRTEPEFLAEVVTAAIDAGATTVNIPDTVGYAIPDEFAELIRYLQANVPNIDKAVLSVHCHNDLGLAVANSLAAIQAGVRQVECTVNGIGERAGNASMEEIVMALKTRKDFFNMDTNIDTQHIMACSKMVSSFTGFFVQRNKAIVGKNAFAHESGIHQHGFLKKKDTFEIMNPSEIGGEASELVMGKHSGRNALQFRISELGHELNQEELDRVFDEFKILADEKKEVFEEDILAIVQKVVVAEENQNIWKLNKVQASVATGTTPTAEISLIAQDGTEYSAKGEGDGPVDAICDAVDKITGLSCKLLDYQVLSKTKGTDALGEVSIQASYKNMKVLGKGIGVNTLHASAQAYVNAVNKLILKDQLAQSSPSEIPGP